MDTQPPQNGHAYSRSCELSPATQYDELLWKFRAVFWEADPSTWQFFYVSEYAELMFGYPRRRWLEEKDFWVKILHPDDRDYAVNLCRQATAAGQDHCFDYRIVAADGSAVWVRDVVRVECDGFTRRPKRLYGIFLDITEQKQRELQHRTDKEKLERLLSQIPAVIWTVDEALRFTSSQGRALSRLHLHPDQILGTTLYEYFATADDNFLPIAMHLRALAGESVSYDFPWYGRIWRTFLEPWHEDERIVGVLGFALDVTEQLAETNLLREKLCVEKHLTSLVKRAERLLRSLTGVSDPAQRWHRTVCGLVEMCGCMSAAIFSHSPTQPNRILAEAGTPLDWASFRLSSAAPRRPVVFSTQPKGMPSPIRVVLVPISREPDGILSLGVAQAQKTPFHACTLRLVCMVAHFLAVSGQPQPADRGSAKETIREEGRQQDVSSQEQTEHGQ